MPRAAAIAVLIGLSAIASSTTARAQGLRSSPGELAASHAALDQQGACTSCHEDDNSVSAAKCLGCHEHQDMKARIDAGVGLHASPKVKGRACTLCHKDHRGRSFDLMGWSALGGESGFDHALTGWALQGKHAVRDCKSCHKASNKQGLRTYLGADRTCGGCHKNDTPHGALRSVHQRCDRCHSETVWNPPKKVLGFDHDDKSQAAMKLEGPHADVTCAKCHPKAVFKLPSFDGSCAQCHKSPHDGQLFGTKKCQTCHSPALGKLDEVRFDHKRQAGHALLGKHAQLTCTTCHTKGLGTREPEATCESCHADDNKHGKRFDKVGGTCTTCHSQRSWKSDFQFNHAKNTSFELTGKHATAACRSCHRGKVPSEFERLESSNGCMGCHQHEKAHGGKFDNTQCLTCHQQPGSKRQSSEAREIFHGEKSRFPLTNRHAQVQCQLCHINDVYQRMPTECGDSCHEDSLHRGSLGPECSRCHESGQWPAVRFDHTADTKWPLRGKHAAVSTCASCHPSQRFKGTSTTCSSSGCHKADDVHAGQLGAACDRCHREDGSNTFKHNRDARFKLDGGHTNVLCAGCHTSITFKPVRSDCVGCHAEPAIHKGRFGTDCARCHSTTTFGNVRALHDVGDFTLTGAHDRLDCARCHPNGEKLRGSGNLCITCHRKDDIHRNALSPKCGECHTQRSFAPARFDHVQVGCSLTGLHATLPCADCHKNGNYGAVSPTCVSCHRNDALRVREPDHRALLECGSCHNPSSWTPANRIGVQSICR